jgi:long-chain-alcohol oxidase
VTRPSPRQRRALEAICDTFAPGSAGRGAPDAILDVVARSPRAAEGRQLHALLTVLGVRFPTLPQPRREAVLRAWCDSRVPQRRTAFQALRKAALHFDAVLPGSTVYEATGYPGALGPAGLGAAAVDQAHAGQ